MILYSLSCEKVTPDSSRLRRDVHIYIILGWGNGEVGDHRVRRFAWNLGTMYYRKSSGGSFRNFIEFRTPPKLN